MPKKPLIGGHVSAAGGIYKAIDNAEAIGAECIQIFGASPRAWLARVPSAKDAATFKERRKNSRVKAVYLHAAYLVNLASPIPGLCTKSIKGLADHLRIADAIGAEGLIFHIGSGKELPKEEAMKKVVGAMKAILKKVPGRTQLVIENTAGGGQKLGANAKDIGEMIRKVGSARVKVCFDTAHAFEAGLIEKYTPAATKALLNEWDKHVGLEHVVALHVNDSKTIYNSHHDQHENIGQGYIGLDGFKVLAKDKRLHDKAWILEVPGFEGTGPDRKNIEILQACFGLSKKR